MAVSGPLIVGCIGSSDPVIREYVHDVGLCTLNLTMAEELLRRHLMQRMTLRAEWRDSNIGVKGLKGKKYLAIIDKFADATLGGLVSAYERDQGKAELVAMLRPLTKARNILLHNHVPLTNLETMTITVQRIQQLRSELRLLCDQARAASDAIQMAAVEVFEALIERVQSEGMPTDPFAKPLDVMLEEYRRTVRNTARA